MVWRMALMFAGHKKSAGRRRKRRKIFAENDGNRATRPPCFTYRVAGMVYVNAFLAGAYNAVRKVSRPRMTPQALGVMSIQSFFGSCVQPYMTQMAQETAAVSGCNGCALAPCRLALICGM